ncbi:MAG: hypothetical protein ACRC8F_01915 [Cetobacterium sp.]
MGKQVLKLEDFLNKFAENEEKKVKITHIDVPNYGLIEFVRPREGVILDFLNEISKGVEVTQDKSSSVDENNINQIKESTKADLKILLEAAQKFVYLCCPMLQAKEVRDKFKSITPYEIPTAVFGYNQTQDLANELSDIFDGTATRKKVEEEIKN